MEATTLNEAQLEMLKLMSVIKTPEELAELKQAISDHYELPADGYLVAESLLSRLAVVSAR